MEYAMNCRIGKKINFLRSIEYEMNLEKLRKKRKEKNQVTGEGSNLAEYCIKRRILQLFKRTSNKFKGDLSVWLQYIDYVKKNDSKNVLSAIFVQALQFHPKKSALWILAANWEFEENSNIAAARTLLQRALRLNPDDQLLWHEYFKLELLYVEKIKTRRRVLGIDDEYNAKINGQQQMDVDDGINEDAADDEEEDDNTIMLPKITGEDMASDDENVDNVKKDTLETLKQGVNPILQGLLATIVYKNAIKDIPNDLDFRTKFVDIYRQFTDIEEGCNMVYDSIRQDMNDNPYARAYLATRHLFAKIENPLIDNNDDQENENKSIDFISISDPAFVDAIKKSVDEFNEAIKDINTSLMWQLYVSFLEEWRSLIVEENLKLYLTKLLQRAFSSCKKKGLLSDVLYLSWAEFLSSEDQLNDAQLKAIEGTKKYPKCDRLWISRIKLATFEEGKDKSQLELYKIAIASVPESFEIWRSYNDWLQLQWQGSVIKTEELEELYFDACRKVTTLLPSVTVESNDRNMIKDLILTNYIEWMVEAVSIEAARKAYKKIIQTMFPTYEFYKTCLRIENEYFQNDKTGTSNIEYIFETLLRLENNKKEIYLSYLSYLYSQNKFQKANTVYWKATKEIENKAEFDIQLQSIKDGKIYNAFSS
ncbi:unnamed protein product [Cunninghamella echinulata]